jgi:hypothetical protein
MQELFLQLNHQYQQIHLLIPAPLPIKDPEVDIIFPDAIISVLALK